MIKLLQDHDKSGVCTMNAANDLICKIKPNDLKLWPQIAFKFGTTHKFEMSAEHYFEVADGNPLNSAAFLSTTQSCRL